MGLTKRFIICLASLLVFLSVTTAQADWTLPDDAINNTGDFGNCSFNAGNNTVTCTNNVNLNASNATLTLTQNLTLIVNPGINTPDGITINPGASFLFTINVGSNNFNMNGSNAQINANIIGGTINVSGTNSVVNGNINASNSVTVNSGATVNGNINSTGSFTNFNNGTVIGDITTSGSFTNNSGALIDGNITAGGSVSNNGTVTNNIDAGGSVTNNSGAVAGSINANGSVTNNGTVLSYINAPTVSGGGDVPVTCDINVNEGPCEGAPDNCEFVLEFSEFGIIGDSNFNYGSGSTINGNTIDGTGNTPTPSGSVTTVPTQFPPIEPAAFPFNLTGGQNRNNQTNIPPGSYGTVRASGNGGFSSLSGGGIYYIETLEISGNDSTIQLGPGDYFIESVTMDNRSNITISPSGLVRMFIGEGMTGQNNIFLNSGGNPGNLIIYLYEDVDVQLGNFNQGSGVLNFSGSFYSPYETSDIQFGNNNNIEGSIISAGEVNVGSNTSFTYSVQTQESIIAAYECTPEDAEIDHFRIRHPMGIVSCFTAPVSVDACADASCSNLYEDPFELTLSSSATGSNWLGGDVVSTLGLTGTLELNNGSGVIGLQNVPGGASTLSVSNSTVAATNPTQCFDPTGTTATSCDIDFQTAGLLFVGASNFNPVPNSFAGEDFLVALRAVETNINTGACEARVEGAQTVDIGVECIDPEECLPDQAYTVDGTEIAFNNSGVSSNLSPVSLTFDANGIALLPHNYTDVGLLRLHASLDLPAEPNADDPDIDDPAVTLTGTSLNDFVVKPHTLVVQALDEGGSIWTATTNTGNGFQAAGSPFTVILQSLNANGDPTPNFGNEATPAGVTADFDSVAFPSGGFNGSLNFAQNFVPDAVYDGAFRSEDVTWSEAGTVNIQARLIGDDYLGAGDAFAKPPSPVGRFFPDRFTVVDSSVADACTLDGFSYMNQNDILVEYTLHALNVSGARTRNYGFGGYSGSAAIAAVATNITPADEIGDDFGTRFSIVSPPDWDNGIMTFSEPNATFARRADNTPDGPFESLQIGLQVTSELDNRGFATSELSLNTQAGDAAPLSGELNLRYGRLALENIGGPEDEDLPVIMRAEYWDGTRFFINELDSCTPTLASSLGIVNNPDNLPTTPDGITSALENGELLFGDLLWQAANEQGEFEFEYVAPAWLQYPWEDDEGNSFDNPRAFGSFGQYRGNNRVIYWLELR